MEAPPSADLLPLLELEDAREGPAPLDLLADPVLPLEDPETPSPWQEWLASSPPPAAAPPPASITITSPGFARSIASTGFAQSPFAVLTVSARPTIFVPWRTWGSIPFKAPRFCIASARFGVETLRNASRTSASPYRLYNPAGN